MAPSGQTKQQDEQRSLNKMATPTQRSSSSSSRPFSWVLLVAMVAAVTVFANGPAPCSASSVDEQSSGDSAPSSSSSLSSSSNLSKEEPQLSAASGLVKRSAPVHASSYGHSIMRFGRAPHNIMHFGKRSQGDQDSAYYQDPESVLDQSSQEVVNSVPDWILANYLAAAKQQQQVAPSNPKVVTKYLLVPVQVPAGAAKSGNFGGPMPIQKKASRGGFSEDSDNVFMHFG